MAGAENQTRQTDHGSNCFSQTASKSVFLQVSKLNEQTSSPGVPPYYMMVRVALWDRCIFPTTPRAPCLPALNRYLGYQLNEQTSY